MATGTGAVTLPNLVASGTASSVFTGTATIILPSLTASGSGGQQVGINITYTIPVETVNAEDVGVPGGGSGGGGPGGSGTIYIPPDFVAAPARVRADLHSWTVNRQALKGVDEILRGAIGEQVGFLSRQQMTDEYIGPKVGGSLQILWGLRFGGDLDQADTWQVSLPAKDINAAPIYTREAKIIRFYIEGMSDVFEGWIEKIELSDDETLTISGSGMEAPLTWRRSLWRHGNLGYNTAFTLHEASTAMLLPATYALEKLTIADEATGLSHFQNETVLEMYNQIGQKFNTHWRKVMNRMIIQIGDMGDDSGLMAAVMPIDDPRARQRGVIPITGLSYEQDDSVICNLLMPQGSNDSFGMAVELRHAVTANRKWGTIPFFPYGQIAVPENGEDTMAIGEDVTPNSPSAFEGFDLRMGNATEEALDTDISAVAQKVVFADEVDISFVSFFGYSQFLGSGGTIMLMICPDTGGRPDHDNPVVQVNMGNFAGIGIIPSVEVEIVQNGPDTTGLKNKFSEILFFPENLQGYWRLPAGTYHFVMTFNATRWSIEGFQSFARIGPFVPTGSTHGNYWGQAASASAFGNAGNNSISTRTYAGDWSHPTPGTFPSWNLLIEINGRYNNADDIAAYPYLIEGQYASAIDIESEDAGTTGQRIFFIRNNASIDLYGLREAAESFPSALDAREGIIDIPEAASTLYKSSTIYMDRRAGPFESFTIESDGASIVPVKGQKMWVQYRGWAKNSTGRRVWVDLNGLYWVLGVQWNLTNDGFTHTFSMASVPEDMLTPAAAAAANARTIARVENHLGEIGYGLHVGAIGIAEKARGSSTTTLTTLPLTSFPLANA